MTHLCTKSPRAWTDDLSTRAAAFFANDPNAMLADIVKIVAEASGHTVIELRGDSKRRDISRARNFAYDTAHREGISTPIIGRFFSRDPSTIQAGINRIKGETQ